MREEKTLPDNGLGPMVVTVTAREVLSLVTSGYPYRERAEDGRSVLMRGPRVSQIWPKRTPAETASYRNEWPEIALTARQVLRAAAGEVVDTTTCTGEAAQVRLPTAAEMLADQKRAIAELGGGVEPMSHERAAELVEPVVVPENERAQFLMIYGETDEPAEGERRDEGESLMSDGKPNREIVINRHLRTDRQVGLELPDGRKLTVFASGTIVVRDGAVELAAYELDLPPVLDVATRCTELGNDRGGRGSGEVPITVRHKH